MELVSTVGGTPQTLTARIKRRIAVGKYREVSARDKSERTRDYTCDKGYIRIIAFTALVQPNRPTNHRMDDRASSEISGHPVFTERLIQDGRDRSDLLGS